MQKEAAKYVIMPTGMMVYTKSGAAMLDSMDPRYQAFKRMIKKQRFSADAVEEVMKSTDQLTLEMGSAFNEHNLDPMFIASLATHRAQFRNIERALETYKTFMKGQMANIAKMYGYTNDGRAVGICKSDNGANPSIYGIQEKIAGSRCICRFSIDPSYQPPYLTGQNVIKGLPEKWSNLGFSHYGFDDEFHDMLLDGYCLGSSTEDYYSVTKKEFFSDWSKNFERLESELVVNMLTGKVDSKSKSVGFLY